MQGDAMSQTMDSMSGFCDVDREVTDVVPIDFIHSQVLYLKQSNYCWLYVTLMQKKMLDDAQRKRRKK